MYLNLIIDNGAGQPDKLFTYLCSNNKNVEVGDRLVVPFGKGDKPAPALVYSILNEKPNFKCKEVLQVLSKKYSFSKSQLYLIYLLRVHYASTYRAAYRLILPSSQDLVIIKKYIIKKDNLMQFKYGDILSEREIKKLFSQKNLKTAIKKAEIEEIVEYDIRLTKPKLEYLKAMFDDIDIVLENIKANALKQIRILKYIHSHKEIEYRKLIQACSCTRQDVLNLCRKGYIEIYSKDKAVDFNKYFNAVKSDINLPKLSDEQQKAYDVFKSKSFQVEQKLSSRTELKMSSRASVERTKQASFKAIINGVTGSGKTRLYFEMAKDVLASGKQVLFLLPEIALTPQILSNIYSSLSQDIAVIHTHVSDRDKASYYSEIKSGKTKVVLGVRSALFAPFKDLGMIIIDESHERTYKSDQTPRYDAINLAMELAELLPCDIVLGSATTNLELFKKAQVKKYNILKLNKRIGGVPLPEISLIDMKNSEKKTSQISEILYNKLAATFEKGEQAMILHNRRGYSLYRECQACHYIEKCINCDLSMAVKNKRGDLHCKYCDYRVESYNKCSNCGEAVLDRMPAVKSVQEELRELFPDKNFVAVDSDSTRVSSEYLKTIAEFEAGKIDAILGTQVIAKGFDFDKVTMAAVINADQIFNSPDYSASETAFNLMYQLAGRAGRRSKQGRVYIQCLDTDHRSLKCLLANDFAGFLQEEDELRKAAVFPPYSKFISIRIVSENDGVARNQAKRINDLLRAFVIKNKLKLVVYGFREQFYLRIKNKYNYYVLLKNIGEDNQKIVKLLYNICVKNKYNIIQKDASVSLDFNPYVL